MADDSPICAAAELLVILRIVENVFFRILYLHSSPDTAAVTINQQSNKTALNTMLTIFYSSMAFIRSLWSAYKHWS